MAVTRNLVAVSGLLLLTIGIAAAQPGAAESPATNQQLQQELDQLRRAVAEVRLGLGAQARDGAGGRIANGPGVGKINVDRGHAAIVTRGGLRLTPVKSAVRQVSEVPSNSPPTVSVK